MKVLIINTVCGVGSTGRIAAEQAERYIKDGHECVIAYGRGKAPENLKGISYRIGTDTDVRINAMKARLFDSEGFNAKAETKRFIKWANNYDPDIVCLHNLHGYYINIELLFDFLKSRPQTKVIWTLHDCWTFTGHCAYFSYVKCGRWENGCSDCPQKNGYPASVLRDASADNYLRKKKCFSGVADMTLITPSMWLSDLVKRSFLGQYTVRVENNRIDAEAFRPTESDFRKRHSLEDKKLVLGVAYVWEERKGLDVFLRLGEMLPEEYRIVLVGVDKKTAAKLPDNIVALPRTNGQRELAAIYSTADVFVNPTKEENFPTVNIEALACGVPVVTFDTGGSAEIIDETCGCSVETGDTDELAFQIQRVCGERPYTREACLERAKRFAKKQNLQQLSR